jgi:hypothetical protein
MDLIDGLQRLDLVRWRGGVAEAYQYDLELCPAANSTQLPCIRSPSSRESVNSVCSCVVTLIF